MNKDQDALISREDDSGALKDLVAREQIRQVLYRYNRGIDRFDRELVLSCYHPDAVDEHEPFVSGDPSTFVDAALSICEEQTELTYLNTGNIWIELSDGCATVESYCTSTMIMKRRADDGSRIIKISGARFLDRFECRAGNWLIAHRQLIPEWSVIIPEAEFQFGPFVPGTSPLSRRDESDPSYVQ